MCSMKESPQGDGNVSKLFWLGNVGQKVGQRSYLRKGISVYSMKEIPQGVSDMCFKDKIVGVQVTLA